MSSVFNKKVTPSCSHCVFGRSSHFSGEILCEKRGVTEANDSCRKYKYDPLKRIPSAITVSDDFTSEDFEI